MSDDDFRDPFLTDDKDDEAGEKDFDGEIDEAVDWEDEEEEAM